MFDTWRKYFKDDATKVEGIFIPASQFLTKWADLKKNASKKALKWSKKLFFHENDFVYQIFHNLLSYDFKSTKDTYFVKNFP